MKQCRKCGKTQESCNFRKAPQNKDGLHSYCEPCRKLYDLEYRRRNNEQRKKKGNAYYAANPLRMLLHNCKKKAVKEGRNYNLTLEYLLELYSEQQGLCFWFKLPLALDDAQHGTPYKVSLDRIDNAEGYIQGNVVLTSQAANWARNRYDVATWKSFLNDLKESL